jgi:hypothetical protein
VKDAIASIEASQAKVTALARARQAELAALFAVPVSKDAGDCPLLRPAPVRPWPFTANTGRCICAERGLF